MRYYQYIARKLQLKRTLSISSFVLFSFLVYVYYFNGAYSRPASKGRIGNDEIYELKHKLQPLKFSSLPLGSIRPTADNWLDRELQHSANGLAGHLWDFYAFVKDSSWLGGSQSRGEYSGLHEGFPYWFNGLVALAYSLRDDGDDQSASTAARLKSQVHEAVDIVLDLQAEDGWLGPETLASGNRLLWGRFPLLLGLTSLVEANGTGWAPRIMPALWKFVELTNRMLEDGGRGFVSQGPSDRHLDGEYSWGRARAADFVLTLQWMFERTENRSQQEMLWQSMEMAYHHSLKWEAWYNDATYIKEDLYRLPKYETQPKMPYLHGVNVAQGLKAPTVMHRFTLNDSLLQTAKDAVDWTLLYHGAASGTILADERINGLSPWSGSELCTTVELIFSLIYIHNALGRNQDADHTELLAYNVLPTMFSTDHWAHQYMTQPNQPWSKILAVSPFFDATAAAQTFGLEPHYPCCTVNHAQGLPKFLAGSWKAVGTTGLAHVLLSPGTVHTASSTIECNTQYPFHGILNYTIDAQAPFTLYLRVPDWQQSLQILQHSPDSTHQLTPRLENSFCRIDISTGTTKLTYSLDATLRISQRANDTVAIYHGALLYALEIQYSTTSAPARAYNRTRYPASYAPPDARDYTLTNTSAWNIAIDLSTLQFHREYVATLPDPIWAAGAPPTYIAAKGCEIDWPLFKGVVPGVPPPRSQRKCVGVPVSVRLVPLGSAKLHMVDIPDIDL